VAFSNEMKSVAEVVAELVDKAESTISRMQDQFGRINP